MQRLYDTRLLCGPIDITGEFGRQENVHFFAEKGVNFDADTGMGTVRWERAMRKPRLDFGKYTLPFESSAPWEFPEHYAISPETRFRLDFVDERTLRIRIAAREGEKFTDDDVSPMLVGPVPTGKGWDIERTEGGVCYRGPFGSVEISTSPWRIEFRDADGKLLTRTVHPSDCASILSSDPIPFGFVRTAAELKRYFSATFLLSPGERVYGTGESFTRLDKRGQRQTLFAYDPLGCQSADMYKPIPFFMSSRGYGMFVHDSCPMTWDFGATYDSANTLFLGDDRLDLFVFFGDPKEVLGAYTALTGRSPLPPAWSFGLWMSRITYDSEAQTRETADELRKHRIPCDVIHLDTGWFEEDWGCDFQFSSTRFKDPEGMIADLRDAGFRVSLWQYPYFLPHNKLHQEIVDSGYAVADADGKKSGEDAILDFSNKDTAEWYRKKIARLIDMGVGSIKVDFGESAPVHGRYASGKSGWFEHNLYPLRYARIVAETTAQESGDHIIWARSAWAGSQRYPLHWSGDCENTDGGMAATLRAGLSFGLSGFTFWSHDIGGFVHRSPRELYRRWLPFGMLTSHSRCHGAPPKEPWHYDEEFVQDFRRAVELKYRLLPYIFTQATEAALAGLPLLRPLFLEYPEDLCAWAIEDEYLFGRDILVAPLFEEGSDQRSVYLPEGGWIDYQTGIRYDGPGQHKIQAGEIPIVILVKEGAIIPEVEIAQSTAFVDWSSMRLRVFGAEPTRRAGTVVVSLGASYRNVEWNIEGELLRVKTAIEGVDTTRWLLSRAFPT